MAQPASPSPLANLIARRANVQRARDAMNGTAVTQSAMRPGKPIGRNEPASAPPQPGVTVPPTPAPQPGEAPAGVHPDTVPEMNTREQALEYTKRVLEQAGNQGKAVAPMPAVENGPGYTVPSLQDQLAELGAQQQSPVMQFMRLAGRAPSAREMAMYQSAQFLSQQLGRNPTKNELLMYMQSPNQGVTNTGPSPILTGIEGAQQ